MRVPGLAFGGIAKQPRNFRLPFDVGDPGELEIAAIGLALAGKRVLEILMSFGSFEIRHSPTLPFLISLIRDLYDQTRPRGRPLGCARFGQCAHFVPKCSVGTI